MIIYVRTFHTVYGVRQSLLRPRHRKLEKCLICIRNTCSTWQMKALDYTRVAILTFKILFLLSRTHYRSRCRCLGLHFISRIHSFKLLTLYRQFEASPVLHSNGSLHQYILCSMVKNDNWNMLWKEEDTSQKIFSHFLTNLY